MSDAIIGYGTIIARGNGAVPEVFTAIAEVISIDGPGLDSDDVEVTHLSSPGGYREYKGGLKEPGEVSMGNAGAGSIARLGLSSRAVV